MTLVANVCALLCLMVNSVQVIDDGEQYFLAQGFESVGGVKAFFSNKTQLELESLQFHASPKVSIYAKWLLSVEAGRNDAKSIISCQHEFIGFISAKTGMPIPSWWKDRLIYFASIRANGEGMGKSQPDWSNYFAETNGVRHSRAIDLIDLSRERVVVRLDRQTREIVRKNRNWEYTDSFTTESPESFAIVSFNGRHVFATSDNESTEITVFCVDDHSNKLWSTIVSRTRQTVSMVGWPWDGVIGIEKGTDCVGVFTCNHQEASVDVFDLENGAVRTRFTTLFEKF